MCVRVREFTLGNQSTFPGLQAYRYWKKKKKRKKKITRREKVTPDAMPKPTTRHSLNARGALFRNEIIGLALLRIGAKRRKYTVAR